MYISVERFFWCEFIIFLLMCNMCGYWLSEVVGSI